jgi:hypothetical protein
MTRKIDPDLFAQLMRLSATARTDLLEFMGQTPLAPDEARRLAEGHIANTNGEWIKRSGE